MGGVYSSRELIRRIEKDGWYLAGVTGSHHHFEHPVKKGKVTIPHPNRELPRGTANCVLKQAGLKKEKNQP